MSQFYDALTDANRAQQGLGQKAVLWRRGIPGIEIPPVEAEIEGEVPPAETAELTSRNGVPVSVQIQPPVIPDIAVAEVNGYLGTPMAATLNKKARLIPHATDSSILEYYRRLRTKILQKREEKPFKQLLVTSANPQEGKTLTVMNLALSFAMLPEFKVLVVDGDFRRGTIGRLLGIPNNQPGLSNLIDGTARIEDVVLQSDAVPMYFMVRGNARASDAHAAQVRTHFLKLAESFDLIIVDSPPVNLLADVQLLASCCEAVLLVARSFVTSRQSLEKAVQELERYNVLGTILNASANRRRNRYYDYYYRGGNE